MHARVAHFASSKHTAITGAYDTLSLQYQPGVETPFSVEIVKRIIQLYRDTSSFAVLCTRRRETRQSTAMSMCVDARASVLKGVHLGYCARTVAKSLEQYRCL